MPCKHLEREMPHPGQSVNTAYRFDIDAYVDKRERVSLNTFFNDNVEALQKRRFIRGLQAVGLEPMYIDILVYRYCYGLSTQEIAEELGVRQSMTVSRMLRRSFEYLRRIGYGKRKKI